MRFTIWVQGCHNACPGCYAAALWDESSGEVMTVEALIGQIKATPDIEGVTFLGGEPFEQAEALARTARTAKELGLSVVTFTGLLYDDILSKQDPHHIALLNQTDLLIDGPYIAQQHDTSRPWVGSANQRYIFLTDRYSAEDIEGCCNRIEFRLNKDGVLRLNGMGDFAAIEKALNKKAIMRSK